MLDSRSVVRMTSRAYSRAILVLCSAAALIFSGGCAQRRASAPQGPPPLPLYPPGATAAGVPIGGMTEAQAARTLHAELKPLSSRSLNLGYGKNVYFRKWSQLGIEPDISHMLARAWKEPTVPLSVTVSLGDAKKSIKRAARAFDVRPIPARLVGEPGSGLTTPGKPGRGVNVPRTAEYLRQAVTRDPGVSTMRLAVQAVPPPFDEEDLQSISVLVARFSTRYNAREESRTHNLRLVTQRLNGAFVKPGGVFSFNGWVGERRESDGFREAIVFKEGLMVQETAGGLCQVSSTLYNVALEAGLPIVQRSHHSLTVGYVPLGRDATVYWGQHDLQFRNDTGMPLYIRARAGNGQLTIEAWGSESLDRSVRITSASRRKGTRIIARVYREIDDHRGKRRELVSEDVYNTERRMAPSQARRT